MLSALESARNLIVRRWGELGGYWGINRTMAELHALLFVAGRPLCTDDVMDQLKISRGNASMNLRALVDWGLIRRSHKFGDRKEYFEADTDIWSMFETIMRERRRREVEPILATIDRCVQMVSPAGAAAAGGQEGALAGDALAERKEFRERLEDLRGFLTTMGALFDLVLRFGRDGLETLAKSMQTVEKPPVKRRAATRAN